jgi:hypothetical protein
LHAIGGPHGYALRDHAADREPDEGCLPDAKVIEKREEIVCVIVDAVGRSRRVREAMPSLIVEDNPISVGEDWSDLLPDPEIASQRVDEDENRPV